MHFLREAYKHGKAIAATGDAVDLLARADLGAAPLAGSAGDPVSADHGLVTVRDAGDVAALADAFIEAIAQHRHWQRSVAAVPA